MVVTEFLPAAQIDQYGKWLKSQDVETKNLYFGVGGSDHIVDSLMNSIGQAPDNHHILVAQQHGKWVGTLHIAVTGKQVEFGLIVLPEWRGQGIANLMIEQALVWARNRGYQELFMHCLGWNKPIQHLCRKHGLTTKNMHGDSEVEMQLPPADWITVNKEFLITSRNLYYKFLQNNWALYPELAK